MGNRGRWSALVAAAAALIAVPTAADAAPKKRSTPRAVPVAGVTGPKAAVELGAKVVLRARARNTTARTGRVSVVFHTSADARRDARDPVLGRARTARLKPGARGTATLTVAPRAAGAYTLFACVRTGGRTRCAKATRKLVVRAARAPVPPRPAPQAPTPPAPPAEQPRQNPPAPGPPDPLDPPVVDPALTLQVASDVEWSVGLRPDGTPPVSGDTITSVLRLGAGAPGQTGYERAGVTAVEAVRGSEQPLLHGGSADRSVPVTLPFAFPFAGVRTSQVAVSTNGWIALAGPAYGGYEAEWVGDYRGAETAVGDNVAGIAPLRADLTLDGPGGQAGRIVLVEPPGGDSVAIRWEAWESVSGARVTFEAVLFRDGRIRFDYPQRPVGVGVANQVIGISPGVVGRSADFRTGGDPLLPSESILFTPRPLALTGPAAAGTATLTLPRDSAFRGGSPGCSQTLRPTPVTEGLVTCPTPAIAAGTSASVAVSWAYPDMYWTNPVQAARWTAGTTTASAEPELVRGVFGETSGASLALAPAAAPLAGMVGVEVVTQRPGGAPLLRRPRIAGTLPAGLTPAGAGTGGGLMFDRRDLEVLCDRLPASGEGGAVSCALPTAVGIGTQFTLLFDTPAAGAYELDVALAADNLPRPLTASTTVTVP